MMHRHIALAALAAGVAACSQDRAITGPAAATAARLAASAAAADGAPGAVYTLMNLTSGNAVAIFARAADGTLTAAGTVATRGTGTGSGLGSQGDRKSTRLNSSHLVISYAVFCLKKKKNIKSK